MRAISRSSIRWGIATVVASLLGALPFAFDGNAVAGKTALADGGGNGRLMAARPPAWTGDDATTDEESEPALSSTNPDPGSADDGDRIGDDSDVASVDRPVNDDDAVRSPDDTSSGNF